MFLLGLARFITRRVGNGANASSRSDKSVSKDTLRMLVARINERASAIETRLRAALQIRPLYSRRYTVKRAEVIPESSSMLEGELAFRREPARFSDGYGAIKRNQRVTRRSLKTKLVSLIAITRPRRAAGAVHKIGARKERMNERREKKKKKETEANTGEQSVVRVRLSRATGFARPLRARGAIKLKWSAE